MADAPQLRLYNTATRTKEDFTPIDANNVRMYVCGPTVYDFAHIGNARPVIVFDVLFRLLRHFYGTEKVTYARNITDVDDKINARAATEYPNLPLNEAIRRVTEGTNNQFQADIKALANLEPSSQPRATEHLDDMRNIIEKLIERGVAYVADEHVLFSPSAMNALGGARYGAYCNAWSSRLAYRVLGHVYGQAAGAFWRRFEVR
jgi:cysteinyl-tRNA synthetase